MLIITGPLFKQWDHSDGESILFDASKKSQQTKQPLATANSGGSRDDTAHKPPTHARSQTEGTTIRPAVTSGLSEPGQASRPVRRSQTISEGRPPARNITATSAVDSLELESSESEKRGRPRSKSPVPPPLRPTFVPEQEGLDGRILESFVIRNLGSRSTCSFGEFKARSLIPEAYLY